MKNITIFTLYFANNIGAYLQAVALRQVLLTISPNCNVTFGKIDSLVASSSHKLNIFNKVLKYFKQGNFAKLRFKIKTNKMYRELQQNMPISIVGDKYTTDYAIIGSDEVWNVASQGFVHYPQFFGHKISAKKIIAYAPSGNGISVEKFREYAPDEDFRYITHLSARDNGTLETVKKISNRNVTHVVDPTALVEDFDHPIPPCPIETDFILVYSYGISKNRVKAIKDFAKKNRLKIISVATYNSWADKNIIATPWEFLSYMKKAQYVITSTFHGTILSIKYNKNFICYSNLNNKVLEILSLYNLKERDMHNHSDIEGAFSTGIDYKIVNQIIKETRDISLNYLKSTLID